ncbi:MAG: 4Fe-4S binding protein [Methanobacteriota archaeon]
MLTKEDIQVPSDALLEKGVAIIECIEEIPCNPCVAICPVHAISMKDINALPRIDFEKCTGCAKCVGVCPGLAIFVVKTKGDKGLVTLPYEFLPIPKVGEMVDVIDREGTTRGNGEIVRVNTRGNTPVITVQVEKKLVIDIRMIRVHDHG